MFYQIIWNRCNGANRFQTVYCTLNPIQFHLALMFLVRSTVSLSDSSPICVNNEREVKRDAVLIDSLGRLNEHFSDEGIHYHISGF